jgi:CBS-domain-containing membrane protein
MKDLPRIAADIMTKEVVTLEETDSLEFLDESMRILQFRHLPVVDGDRLIGMVSQRDLLSISASSLLPAGRQQSKLLTRKFTVRDIMTRNVVTVGPEMPLTHVAALLRQKRVGCLPVVKGENTLVGVITEADFVDLAATLLKALVH